MPQPDNNTASPALKKTLTITADAGLFDSAIEALCFHGGWAQSGDKTNFAKGVLLDFLGKCLIDLEAENARLAIEQLTEANEVRLAAIERANEVVRDNIVIKFQ